MTQPRVYMAKLHKVTPVIWTVSSPCITGLEAVSGLEEGDCSSAGGFLCLLMATSFAMAVASGGTAYPSLSTHASCFPLGIAVGSRTWALC